jgi:type IV fimbrial biogenesis protein FimT
MVVCANNRGPGGQRGFTLAELLAVLGVIGIIAAASAPSMVRVMRDKRVGAAASAVADLYRLARTRAMARGAAVVVRWDQSHPAPTNVNPAGRFTMLEAVAGSGDQFEWQPVNNCAGTDWSDAALTSKFLTSFDDRWGQYQPAAAQFYQPDGGPVAYAEICFSPRGRTFIRYGALGAFMVLAGVPVVELVNTESTFGRRVVVPPSGAARVVTRM